MVFGRLARAWSILAVIMTCATMALAQDEGEHVLRTSFLPSKHGFRFVNFGGAAVLPFGQLRLRSQGHCLGMCQAAADFHAFGVDRDRDVEGEVTTDPLAAPPIAEDSLTFRWIERRHGEYPPINAIMYANWLKYRTGADVPGGLGRRIMQHGYTIVRDRIGRGKPCPICILGSGPRNAIAGHEVVVYKITENFHGQPGRILLHVYDPNAPNDDSKSAVVRGPGDRAGEEWSFVYHGGDDIRYDFFWPIENFEPREPRR